MDLDTTTTKGAHDQLLRQFSEGGADILLGTQMVAKGLDFSRVTLVGVISADIQMLLPDFRSSERTFQLLTQVAGRAGRSTLAGEVIIQTFQPRHPSLKHVITHNFTGFYSEEIADRRELNYPPFSRLILIEFKGKNGNEVIEHAQNFRGLLKKQNSHFLVLGPAAAALARLKGLFRWHIILKSLKAKDTSGKIVHGVLQEAVDVYRKSPGGKSKSVKMIIDVDPVGMM
jgi:primosomal protein N' (replication factor Y)